MSKEYKYTFTITRELLNNYDGNRRYAAFVSHFPGSCSEDQIMENIEIPLKLALKSLIAEKEERVGEG